MRHLWAGVSLAAIVVAAASGANAQSTGSREFDQEQIVVTGSHMSDAKGVGGVIIPDTAKTRQVLTSEFIQHQTPGQSIDEIINQMPGVSFQNNDPYGSAGGTLTIRGFDSSRISQTFDGIPLNDTGNYAIYSNQQLDSELIDQVNVSLGSTDIDSPTASATGSTVNYITRTPDDDFHIRAQGSAGDFNYFRLFGVVDTGAFGPWGTKAWLAASDAENDVPFNKYGKIKKQQYNAKIYQPIGTNGDFVSLAGHYNQNRNNFFGSIPLRNDASRTVGTASSNRFPLNGDERDYSVARCTIPAGVAGAADTATSTGCGTAYDYRFNPSNTGNIRVNSKFSLTDRLALTVDPFFEYTKANGGGTVLASEKTSNGLVGYLGHLASTTPQIFAGHDLNGDGDALDTVNVLAPSNTITHRYGVIANLRYDFTPTQVVRVNYTLDYGRHKQTGEALGLTAAGQPLDVFPINDPILDSNGNIIEKRNRFSKAILNQVSGEYRGKFFDEKLTISGGVRAPFFERKLNNFCFTTSASGSVDCIAQTATAAYALANPTYAAPQQRDLKYNKVLPSGGLTYDVAGGFSVYGSYSKGLQVPGTDSLYNSFFFASSTDAAHPKAETTDNFDTGVRFKSGNIQAQLAGWYTNFKNRLASSYDPDQNVTVYRNLGTVHKYGADGSVSYQPIRELTLYAFGSYLKSKILDDVQSGETATGAATFLATGGKRESGSPTFTFGGRAQATLGPVELGIQAKRTGPRYVNDQNLPVVISGVTVFGAKAPAYNVVDLDARFSLAAIGLNDRTFFQLNVTNLFDKFYVGGFGGTSVNTAATFVQIGSPRAVSGTVVFGF